MARKSDSQPLTSEEILPLHFPKAGLDVSCPAGKQPRRPASTDSAGKQLWIYTCADGRNVRSYDPRNNRLRGASRPGLVKFFPLPVGSIAGWIVQELNLLSTSGITPPGGTMQQSQSGRVVKVVAVSRGRVFTASPGDTTWHAATNNSGGIPALNSTGVMQSAQNGQRLWFADGVNYVYYDPSTDTVEDWTASAGALPVDSNSNTPRLICTWRGRTVLSGLVGDRQNWFMSAVDAPRNFDYSPLSITATMAVAGNNSPAGLVGDTITALVPYNDDVLIFGGDHTIWLMNGDPADGGRIDLVSDIIGFAWGQAWCKGSDGAVYFMTNRAGVYKMIPGQAPVQISQSIQNRIQSIDTGKNGIRMVWDERFQGFHLFVTDLSDRNAVCDHYFYDARVSAWWPDRLGRPKLNPLACCVMDGNEPGDRVPLIGSWDGYVRTFDADQETDDSYDFTSSVVIGPILTKNFDDVLLKDLQAVFGMGTGTVTWEVLVGRTAEAALASAPVASGTWTESRSFTENVRRAGHAVYLRLSSTEHWSLEAVRARFAGRGKVRMRGA